MNSIKRKNDKVIQLKIEKRQSKSTQEVKKDMVADVLGYVMGIVSIIVLYYILKN
jgi:hypothetical protein